MTAIALAVSVPFVISMPAEARDRHDGGRHGGVSSGDISGGNISRNSFWKHNRHARNDHDRRRNRDRNVFGRDIVGGNMFRDNRHWRRDWRARNDWRFGRDWQDGRPSWVGQPDLWRNRVRPYYAGPYRPYYAGQHDDRERFNNNFYGGSISAYDDPGNGMYFYMDDYGDGMGDARGGFAVRPANNAKVIIVSPETETSSCSFEAGVCVIRP